LIRLAVQRNKRKTIVIVAGLVLTAGCLHQSAHIAARDCVAVRAIERTTDNTAWVRNLDAYLDSVEHAGRSGVVLIAKGEQVRYTRGFGYADREQCVPNTDSTLFDIASIAKVFTAVAVAQLEDQGKLRETDSLPQFFSSVPADKSRITIRNLLTHTAGLQSFHDTAGDFEVMSREEAVRRILRDSLRFAPGTREAYSNSGYTLLAAIVEKQTGKRFEDYVRENVIGRAMLRHAWFWGDSLIPPSASAIGYVGSEASGKPWTYQLTWASQGGAGLVMDARDVYRLTVALERGVLVSRQNEAAMQVPLLERWAEGWEVSQTPFGRLVMKGGASDLGFTAQLRRYVDKDVVIVLLLNSKKKGEDWPHQQLAPEISAITLAGLSGQP
jgi:CubicO group peptidase (beta-lactamase class C family)